MNKLHLKKLLVAATMLTAFLSSSGASATQMCGDTTTTGNAVTLNQQECISGNGLYFYLDIENNNTALEIVTSGGNGEADIFTSSSGWATRSNYNNKTSSAGTNESLKVIANAGRLYISIFGIHQEVNFKVQYAAPSNTAMCGATTLSGYPLTLEQQECISGNGLYYYIEVEQDNTELTISTAGGSGDVDIFVNTASWATRTNNIASSENDGTENTLTLMANSGRLYVSLFGINQEVSFKVSATSGGIGDGPGNGTPPDDTSHQHDAQYLNLTPAGLVDEIIHHSVQDISPLFQLKGNDAKQLYSNENLIAVANAIKSHANNYSGVNDSGIEQLLYFMRAAYYVEFYVTEVGPFSADIAPLLTTSLRSFFDNNNAWQISKDNGPTLKEALMLIDSAILGAQFNDVTIKVLTDYNSDWSAIREMNSAANAVFTTLFRAQWNNELKAIFTEDPTIFTVLNNFQVNHRNLLGTDAEYVLINAVRELSRMYYVEAQIPRVKALVKNIIFNTNKNDATKVLWLAAASMADYYDRADCGYYDICGFAYQLEKETLSFHYKCSDTLKIRAQDLFNDQAAWICDVLGTQETNFHQTLKTLGIPVTDDNNSSLELVIFDSADDYGTYAGQFFNINTNNGGMYLEGAPSVDKNQARFIAYEAAWERPNFHVWNLQHEYVHYLDARFDLYGDFMRGMSVNTVWWTEGLAEYISKRDDYPYAITLGETLAVPLSEVFKNTYDSGQDRIYRWGYLAIRFMFEKHSAVVDQIVSYTRNDQYTEYQSLIDSIGTSYDAEFNAWLVSGLSTTNSGIVQYGPNDVDSTASGQAGNWAGEPETISTDFSPCIVEIPSQKHDAQNNTITLNSTVECVNSSGNRASFIFANTDGLSSQLTITTSGGWGDANILYRADNWATMQNNDAMVNGDGNDDSLTITLDSSIYWHYITLDGEFGGVKLQLTTSP